jgi:hypothetical protein
MVSVMHEKKGQKKTLKEKKSEKHQKERTWKRENEQKNGRTNENGVVTSALPTNASGRVGNWNVSDNRAKPNC